MEVAGGRREYASLYALVQRAEEAKQMPRGSQVGEQRREVCRSTREI